MDFYVPKTLNRLEFSVRGCLRPVHPLAEGVIRDSPLSKFAQSKGKHSEKKSPSRKRRNPARVSRDNFPLAEYIGIK